MLIIDIFKLSYEHIILFLVKNFFLMKNFFLIFRIKLFFYDFYK